MTLPVRRSMKRSGGASSVSRPKTANAVCVRSRITGSGEPEDEEDCERPPAAARERLERPRELRPRVAGRRQGLLALDADREAVGEAQVGDGERDQQEPDGEHGQRGPQRAAAPDRQRDRRPRAATTMAPYGCTAGSSTAARAATKAARAVLSSSARAKRSAESALTNASSAYIRPTVP